MDIIKPEVRIESQDWNAMLKHIELKGRECYKSEDRITDDSSEKFMASLMKRGHLSVIEHEKISVEFIVDRGVSHEIVRHRIGSYSQESTRYCNYGNADGGITVIEPFFFLPAGSVDYGSWLAAMEDCEKWYLELLANGATPQEARSVLPNSLKTGIWATYNLREWIHFFMLRAAKEAHPQMRQVAIPGLLAFQEVLPSIFGNIPYDTNFPKEHYAKISFI
jgi:thymidylate synthase (FAD)